MTYYLYKPTSSRTWRMRTLLIVLFSSLLAAIPGLIPAFAEDSPNTTTPSPVIINEVKSGGSNTTPAEYVTIYNQSDQAIDLAGWTIEYAKAAFPAASCSSDSWKTASSSNATATSLNGTLAAHSVSQPYVLSINNDAAGSIHVVDATHTVTDLLGWGNDASTPACKEGTQATMLNSSKSLLRYLGCISSIPVDSNDNAADFMISNTPTPGQASTVQAPECTPPVVPGPDETGVTDCPGVIISEALPNPAGTDTGHEFIELHNTTSAPTDLSGYSLQTSANDKTFALTSLILQPDEYYSIDDTKSGLTLSNSGGGTIWLLNADQELQSVTYPADMEDDTSWMLADGQWDVSYTPTPAQANILTATKPCPDGQIRNSETGRCVAIDNGVEETALTPCDPGQERNLETNRCRAITSTASSAACPVGQVRNSETNRCRSVATVAAATPAACKAGQERNPETNRCRNITAASTSKACPAGQERNPETNRCRKISAVASGKDGSSLDNVKDVATSQIQQNKPYWAIAAVVLLGAIAYAIYEWRQEIKLFWSGNLSRIRSFGRA